MSFNGHAFDRVKGVIVSHTFYRIEMTESFSNIKPYIFYFKSITKGSKL